MKEPRYQPIYIKPDLHARIRSLSDDYGLPIGRFVEQLVRWHSGEKSILKARLGEEAASDAQG